MLIKILTVVVLIFSIISVCALILISQIWIIKRERKDNHKK